MKYDPVAELQRLLTESGIQATLHGRPVNLVDFRDRLDTKIADAFDFKTYIVRACRLADETPCKHCGELPSRRRGTLIHHCPDVAHGCSYTSPSWLEENLPSEPEPEPRDMLILCLKQPAMGGYALWWGPNRSGYYAELEGAGRYTKSEAEAICGPDHAGAAPIPVAEAVALARIVMDQGDVLRAIANKAHKKRGM